MKKAILILMLLMSFTFLTQAQSKSVESLYNKYKNDKDFFHMDLAGSFLGIAEGMNINFGEADMGALANSVERVKLFKLPVNGTMAEADFKALQKGLKREQFEVMMEISEKDSGILMYSKGGNKIKDIVLLISGDGTDDHMVISLEGEFDAQAIADAGQKVVR